MEILHSVSKEVAKVARDKGFAEETVHYYLGSMELANRTTPRNWNEENALRTAAPVHKQLLDWFRKCYDIDIYYRPILEDDITYNYIISQKGTLLYSENNIEFDTWRYALDAAFLKAFEMI